MHSAHPEQIPEPAAMVLRCSRPTATRGSCGRLRKTFWDPCKRFQPKAQEKCLLKMRPGEASRLSGPSTVHRAACGDSLPPPLRKPGSLDDACSRAGGNQCRSGGPRLATGLRGLWSVSGGSRPAPLPSLGGGPVAKERCSFRLMNGFLCRRRLRLLAPCRWQSFASPQTWKPPANWILQCLSPLFEPGSTTQRTMHGCVMEECNRRSRVGRENGAGAVDILCKTGKACGRRCKTGAS